MLQQEPLGKLVKTLVRIPSFKRYSKPDHSLKITPSEFFGFSFQGQLELLRSEIHDLKPELELKPDKSDFTRVFFNQDENQSTEKPQNSQLEGSQDDVQNYRKQLKKLIQSLADQDGFAFNEQKQLSFNTKNILRNISNAQNQFILFHHSAQQIIEVRLQNSQKFKRWVNNLRFHTFDEFQKIWSQQYKGVYHKLYKKLCRKFYIQNAIPYLMNSRIKNKETKLSHFRYLYRFLEGLQDPCDFFYFKKKDKEKQG